MTAGLVDYDPNWKATRNIKETRRAIKKELERIGAKNLWKADPYHNTLSYYNDEQVIFDGDLLDYLKSLPAETGDGYLLANIQRQREVIKTKELTEALEVEIKRTGLPYEIKAAPQTSSDEAPGQPTVIDSQTGNEISGYGNYYDHHNIERLLELLRILPDNFDNALMPLIDNAWGAGYGAGNTDGYQDS